MTRLLAASWTLLWLLAAAPGPARADPGGTRVALVIGNSAYRSLPALSNPANDAKLIARTLQGLGFSLVGGGPLLDLDKAGFDRAVQDFGTALRDADVGLFYYAGHGVQVGGANWLMPVGANPAAPRDLDFQMVDAGLVLKQMQYAKTRLNIVILDACRNNPFSGSGLRAAGGGLAEMRAPEGTLIAYATQPGSVAYDGAGANSPFSEALASALVQPGLDVFRLFNTVGLAVKRVTGGTQQPWVSSSPIEGDFVFSPGTGAAVPGPPPTVALVQPPEPAVPPPTVQATLIPPMGRQPPDRPADAPRAPGLILASVRALNEAGRSADIGFQSYAKQFDLKRGPTGRERSVSLWRVFGTREVESLAALRAALDGGGDAGADAGFAELAEPMFPIPAPASPDPVPVAAARFLAAAQALRERLAEADPYYDGDNYRDDGYARGKSMHPGIVASYRDLLLARAAFHQSVSMRQPAERETFLSGADPARRAVIALVLRGEAQARQALGVITTGWDAGKGPRGIDQARLKAETDLYERAVTELRSRVQGADGEVNAEMLGTDLAMQLGFYLKEADTFLRACRLVSRALRSGEKLEYPVFGFRDGSEQDIYSRFYHMILSANRLTQ